MKRGGFSIVEAMIAAAIVAIGLTAAATLVATLLAKDELNVVSLRAANLQEQAVTLYRMGLSADRIRGILPESCTVSSPPALGSYKLDFGVWSPVTASVTGGSSFSFRVATNSIVYAEGAPGGSVLSYRSNSVTIVQPATFWPVP